MNVRRLRTLCVEIYKTLNDLNPSFMNNIFKLKVNGREVCDKYKLNLDISKWNQNIFGYKNLKVLSPKTLNNLLYHAKSSKNLDTFKNLFKNWHGNSCKYTLCKKWYLLKSFILIIIYSVYFILYWTPFT